MAFERGAELFGKSSPVVSESISMPDVLATISRVTGRQVAYQFTSDKAIRSLPFGWAAEVGNMYHYFREGGYQVRSSFACWLSGSVIGILLA